MMLSQIRQSYWTVARQITPTELYVDTREGRRYNTEEEAQIDADARNIDLITTFYNVTNPDSKFLPVKVTKIECVQTA